MFKIGDIVRVKEDLIVDKRYNECLFTSQMEEYKGKEYQVTNTWKNKNGRRYTLDGTLGFNFSNEMLELVTELIEIKPTKFKVGDKIKLKKDKEKDYTFVKGGVEYTIENFYNTGEIQLKELDSKICFYVEDFELVKEAVNHPQHYNYGIEAIDVIESWDLNFSLGNAIKYILRAPHKGNTLEDLKKARWYVNREIEKIEKLAKEDTLVL